MPGFRFSAECKLSSTFQMGRCTSEPGPLSMQSTTPANSAPANSVPANSARADLAPGEKMPEEHHQAGPAREGAYPNPKNSATLKAPEAPGNGAPGPAEDSTELYQDGLARAELRIRPADSCTPNATTIRSGTASPADTSEMVTFFLASSPATPRPERTLEGFEQDKATAADKTQGQSDD